MTWSYADPSTAKDEVRWLVGDTDTADQQISDEEINHVLTIHPQVVGSLNYIAGAVVADAIASKYARKRQRQLGSLSSSDQQIFDHYLQKADELREMAATGGRGRAGGVLGKPLLSGGGRTYLGGNR